MNQSKAFGISLVFAGLAMLLVFLYVDSEKKQIRDEFGEEVTVVVAREDINEMQEISTKVLETKRVPKRFVQPGVQFDPNVYEGTIAAAPFKAGEQVPLSKVLLKGGETGLATQVAVSKRGIAIPISDTTGVNRLVRPGDRVDLIANVTYEDAAGKRGSEIKTILQDVQIIAVGEMIQNNIPQVFEEDPISGGRRAKSLRGSRGFATITVEVTPLEAQSLIYLVSSGTDIFSTLRNPVDRVVQPVPTTTVDEVLGQNSKKAEIERRMRIPAAAPVVAAPPPPPRMIFNPMTGTMVPAMGGGIGPK